MPPRDRVSTVWPLDDVLAPVELEALGIDDFLAGIENTNPYIRYQSDPAGFGRDVFGEQYTADIVRVMQSVRDYPVTIAKSANATGKTHGAARVAVWFYKCFPDAQVFTAAAPPLENLTRLLWGQIGDLTIRHPALFTGDSLTNLNITQGPQSFVTGVTIPASGTPQEREAKFSGKHAPHLLFIVDEGDAVPDEVYRGIEACMSGGHARLLVMFNPRSPSGNVYRMERDRLANVVELSAFNHPNVVDGRDVIPGAVTRETTVRRINEWSRPLASDEGHGDYECFEVPAVLVGTVARSHQGVAYPPLVAGWRRVTVPALDYMTIGRYPGQAENTLIARSWIDAARARWDLYVAMHGENPPEGTQAIMGDDVAEFGGDLHSLCFRYGGWVAPIIKWAGMDPDAAAIKAADLYKVYNARLAQVDGTGVGAGVAPALVRMDCMAISVKVASSPTFRTEMGEFGLLRDQLWWATREWLRTDPGAMLPPDEMLLEELALPTYGIKAGKIKVMDKETMRELLKRSPDTSESLILTFSPDGVQIWLGGDSE